MYMSLCVCVYVYHCVCVYIIVCVCVYIYHCVCVCVCIYITVCVCVLDMAIYGEEPASDSLALVVCEQCGRVVKSQALSKHKGWCVCVCVKHERGRGGESGERKEREEGGEREGKGA